MKISLTVVIGIGCCFILFSHLLLYADGAGNSFAAQRKKLAYNHLHDIGIHNPKVLDAIYKVKRHLFLPRRLWSKAYEDVPLPLGNGNFAIEPSLVALIADKLSLTGNERILVIGTHEGYLCAVLAKLARAVFAVETDYKDYKQSQAGFFAHRLSNIWVSFSSRYFQWKHDMTFDRIVVNGAVSELPPEIFDLLKDGGILIAPVGDPAGFQKLVKISTKGSKREKHVLATVMFPPLK